jgi:hypothetical protein
MVLFFQILLIILVAAPVLALALYMWLQVLSYVRQKNRQDSGRMDSAGSGRKKR